MEDGLLQRPISRLFLIMDQDYFELYPTLFARHWWWRSRESVILAELQRIRPDEAWGSILDVGCGDGLFFPKLAKMGEVEGVEPGGVGIDTDAGSNGQIHRVPFDDEFDPGKQFDLILMLDVLEHLDEPAEALVTASGLLRPGGTLFVTVPAYRVLWTYHDELNHHHTRFTRQALREVMEPSGLDIGRMHYFFHWIFPIRIAIRLFEATTQSNSGPPRIPPRWLNQAIIKGSELEYRLLRRFRIPLGSSLLMVAKKAPSS